MKDRWQHLIDCFLLCLFTVVVVLVVALVVMATTGCSTITPHQVQATQTAFSGNDQTAGIVGPAAAGAGYVVTADFRARYNALVEIYGRDILPSITADAGITARPDGTWLIDKQHLVDEILMADWHRMGRAP